jgi:hypothetical protein
MPHIHPERVSSGRSVLGMPVARLVTVLPMCATTADRPRWRTPPYPAVDPAPYVQRATAGIGAARGRADEG